jgi:hypothetical protein
MTSSLPKTFKSILVVPDLIGLLGARAPKLHVVVIDKALQRLNRRLPFIEILFGLWQLLDIIGGVLEGDELAAARKRDRVIERTFPSAISHRRGVAAGVRSRSRRLHFSAVQAS